MSPNADGENIPATAAHGPNSASQAAVIGTQNPGNNVGKAASPAAVAGKVQSSWKPSSHPPGSADRAAADAWHARLNSMRNMTNPVTVQEAITWQPEHPVSPDLQHKIFTATQTFLDMLPRDLVKDLGPFTMTVKPSLDEDAAGEDDFMTDTLSLSFKHIDSCTTTQLRGVMWHEMAHWLYFSASVNPSASKDLKEWRAQIDAHWARRTAGEIAIRHPKEGWTYVRDGLISDYAGRRYPGHDGGLEIPSVYLEQAALGPDVLAKWCKAFPSEKETFDIVLSVFNK